MDIRELKVEDILTVMPLRKRIDASWSPELKAFMLDRINSGHTKIILDLSEVDFIDSTGLGTIVASLKAMTGKGELAISGLGETVGSIFSITHMEKIFKIFPSRQEAVEALR